MDAIGGVAPYMAIDNRGNRPRFNATGFVPVSHQLLRPTRVHIRQQVLTSLSTQSTAHLDGLERELLYSGSHVPPAAFALNQEILAQREVESKSLPARIWEAVCCVFCFWCGSKVWRDE